MKFETIQSQLIYQGRVFSLQVDEVRLPDGNTARLDIINHGGGIAIVPLDDQGNILFVRQYRQPAKTTLLELPAGALKPGEYPEDTARREIREETGMAAEKLLLLREFFLAPGYSTEYMYIYLATGLSPAPLQGDEDEFITVEAVPVKRAYAMLENGELQDSKTMLGLYLASPHLKDKK